MNQPKGDPRRVTLTEFENKLPGLHMNPCEIESAASLKCMEQNNFQHHLCQEYFTAYRDCKKIWLEERKKARFG
ncbi:hypothetical protein BB561_001106 [Smittium simulii]|uniref:Cytochrome c oxidase-assembly factor COX23, mitochondrial n=1 Tax=Smittium simulii TaxID=133385 RepID=A0A2T9YW66_9FUNG|nr:hypothetical protein BB561_001106 [Smittium simulii]